MTFKKKGLCEINKTEFFCLNNRHDLQEGMENTRQHYHVMQPYINEQMCTDKLFSNV